MTINVNSIIYGHKTSIGTSTLWDPKKTNGLGRRKDPDQRLPTHCDFGPMRSDPTRLASIALDWNLACINWL